MRRILPLLITLALTAVALSGCSGRNNNNASQVPDVPLDTILDNIRSAYGAGDYLPNLEIPEDLIETEFGLVDDMIVDALGEMPMMSTHPDRVLVVKAAEGKADEVEEFLNRALEIKQETELQYPVNIPKTNAGTVVRKGDYVAFLLVGAPLDNLDVTEAEAAQYFEDEVQKAVTAFNASFEA